MSSTRSTLRQAGVAVRAMVVCTIVLGVGYTALITGVAQLVLPAAANGSMVSADGRTVGSALIGQAFVGADGSPLPQYFQSRPSAAGDGYDAGASSGSNLGPENADLVAEIQQRRADVAALEGVPLDRVPVDAVTASASGLDPDISRAYAELQVPRVAASRGLDEAEVRALVEAAVHPRDFGYLGEERVNVLELNIALDARGR